MWHKLGSPDFTKGLYLKDLNVEVYVGVGANVKRAALGVATA